MEFLFCNKRKTDNALKFSCLKSIIGKILKSVIINIGFESASYCISRTHRLLGQTTKQPLSNFKPQKPWKHKQLSELKPEPSCYKKLSAVILFICNVIIIIKMLFLWEIIQKRKKLYTSLYIYLISPNKELTKITLHQTFVGF